MNTYSLLNRDEYFNYLINRCQEATPEDTIVIATMEFRPDQPIIKKLVESICKAANSGAKITFILDSYSFMLRQGNLLGPVYFMKKDPKRGYGDFKSIVNAVHNLRENGVTCEIINKPNRLLKNPFRGRSHIKFAVINNEILVGGCNLSNPEQLDVMVKTVSKKAAQYLAELTDKIIQTKNVKLALEKQDAVLRIDDETELLIDAGVRKQSVIYDRAFKLINDARKMVYMTCQYFPNMRTPSELAKAHHRGVDVNLVYNHPHKHKHPVRGAQERTVAYKKKRLPESVFTSQLDSDRNYLHAKIMLSEKEAIVGSHNFVKMGVNFGTAEIALHSTSKQFIKAAKDWVDNL